ncbi:MAG: glycosyltransferase family 39 protein [Candidatus Woesebacteria bacterium]|nr:glycosyltransferase family 39 protein [Candidatus Woesebacteria bacterium]
MIITVLIFAFLLRVISLNQSLWLDEATTALVARMPIYDFFTRFMPADFHPPLYYLAISLWSTVFGYSEVALRIPSVIFGLLTIYVVYLIAKEIKLKYPLLPALFLATSGLHVYYSQEARMYGLVTWLVSYLVLTFIKRDWLKFSILLPLIFLTDYVSLLILPVLFLYKRSRKLVYSTIPLAITFLVWLPILTKQLTAGMSIRESAWWNLLGPVTFKNVALIPTKFMIGRVSFDNKLLYAIIIFVISIIFIYIIGKARNKLNWYWFGLSLLLGILLSFFIPTLTYFRYLFILPAFYLLLSESTSKIFIIIILFINLLSTGFYLFDSRFQREDWRGVAKLIADEKIVFPVNSQKEALIYYSEAESHGKNIISKEQISKDDTTIWLSRYVWEIFDKNDSTRKYIEDLGYNKVSEVNFNGVLLYKYENSN